MEAVVLRFKEAVIVTVEANSSVKGGEITFLFNWPKEANIFTARNEVVAR